MLLPGAVAVTMASLRDRQVAAIRTMLGASPEVGGADVAGPPEWKVLVYDRAGQDIIAPLMNVAYLRKGLALLPLSTHTRIHVHAHTQTHTRARTHTNAHAHTCLTTHTHARPPYCICISKAYVAFLHIQIRLYYMLLTFPRTPAPDMLASVFPSPYR